MRIFILHNTIRPGSYAGALFHLMVQFLAKQGFSLSEHHDLKSNIANGRNSAVIFYTGKKALSLFSRVSVQTVLKKQDFDYLIQVTDYKPIASNLSQLILSNSASNLLIAHPSKKILYAVCASTDKIKFEEIKPEASGFIKEIFLAPDDDFCPITWSKQQAIKMQHAQGREYFITMSEGKTIESVIGLLKSFSKFKKWPQSNMKLIIIDRLPFAESNEWKEKFGTYKFREDVTMLSNINKGETIQLLGSAYAFIHFPNEENDVLPTLQSLQCETPVISFTSDALQEYAGYAMIPVDRDNYDQLAEKMILLYKDESLRNQLIQKGKKVSLLYTKEKTFQALAEALAIPVH